MVDNINVENKSELLAEFFLDFKDGLNSQYSSYQEVENSLILGIDPNGDFPENTNNLSNTNFWQGAYEAIGTDPSSIVGQLSTSAIFGTGAALPRYANQLTNIANSIDSNFGYRLLADDFSQGARQAATKLNVLAKGSAVTSAGIVLGNAAEKIISSDFDFSVINQQAFAVGLGTLVGTTIVIVAGSGLAPAIVASFAATQTAAWVENNWDSFEQAYNDAIQQGVDGITAMTVAVDYFADLYVTTVSDGFNQIDSAINAGYAAYDEALLEGGATILEAIQAGHDAYVEAGVGAVLWASDWIGGAYANAAADLLDGLITLEGLAGGLTSTIGGWYSDTVDKFIEGINENSPLVIDLDGDGIELTSLSSTSVYWDIDLDGFAEATGWVGKDDGLLVLDQNANGIIDDHTELFGNESIDGFTLLGALDSNKDGVIDVSDNRFLDLQVWQDKNQNGQSEAEELSTLNEVGISLIDLNASEVDIQIAGNNITHTSSVTLEGGGTREIVDAHFAFSNSSAIYNQSYSLDPAVAYLPDIKGYGELPDLFISMSLDNDINDANSLIALVSDFETLISEDVFTDDQVALDSVRNIMFRWAGVDEVAVNSRGTNIDARELAFLEKLMGEPFLQHGYQPNPAYFSGLDLQDAFQSAQHAIMARLLVQSVGGDLFEGNFIYNVITDNVDYIEGLNLATLNALSLRAGDAQQTSDTTAFWKNVVLVIDELVGVNNLSGSDFTALSDAITASDVSLTLQDVQAALEFQVPGGQQELGTTGDDVLNAGSGNDDLIGLDGNDTLNGLSGFDTLKGDGGNDILDGGFDDDLSFGGLGDDTFIFNVNYGLDTILDDGGNDTIKFGPFISLNDLTITRVANEFLQIDVDTPQGGGTIVSENHFERTGGGTIENLEFDDGSTFDLTSLNYTLTGTQFADTLLGVEFGGQPNDTIFGGDGNDSINGFDGDDSLHGGNDQDLLDGAEGNDMLFGDAGNDHLLGRVGDDRLDGGAGDDRLEGDVGNDTLHGGTGDDDLFGQDGNDTYTFSYGDGDDFISEFGAVADVDKILFDASIPQSMVTYARVNGNDLQITVDGGTGGTITIDRHFSDQFKRIEQIEFDDGTVVDPFSLAYETFGTEGNDFLFGITAGGQINDTMFGLGGNDELRGGAGDDVLSGGDGDDVLRGEAGNDTMSGDAGDDQLFGGIENDTYQFDYGDGNDTFSESGTNAADDDVLEFGAGITQNMIELTRVNTSDMQIVIDGGAGGTITLDRHFQSANFGFDKIVLDDATEIDFATQAYTTFGSDNADNINGITVNGSNVDTIFAGDGADDVRGDTGNDTLYGEGGNDTLRGEEDDDVLIGGAGDDRLEGGSGADTYIFNYGDGNDTIAEPGGASTVDTIQFGAGITESMLSFSRVGHNMVIEVDAGLGGSLTLESHFLTAARNLEKIVFDDLSEIDLLTKEYTTFGTENAESITGITNGGSDNDTIFGLGGNDQLIGGTGDDVIYGGDGLDTMTGSAGADTFGFEMDSAGNDVDVITDFDVVEGDKLDLSSAITFNSSTGDIITDFVEIVDSGINAIVRIDADGLDNGVNFIDVAVLNGINGLTDEAQLVTDGTLIVEGANTAPMANDDAVTTDEDTAVVISALANDTDGEMDNLTITNVAGASNGTVTHDGTDIIYTPNANFNGTDMFTYTIDDGNGGTDTALVTVTVNPVADAPEAGDDAAFTDEDTPVVISVLANDTDGDNDVLTISSVGTATNGTVTHDGTNVTYTPNANFNGGDSFTYTVSDGNGGFDTATVNVTVNAVNDNPVAEADSFTTDEDTALNGNLLADNGNGADSDVDGDSLSVVAENITSAAGGTVTILANGDFTYTPAANFNGADSFSYTVNDGNGGSAVGSVSLTVNAVNDAPSTTDDSVTTDEDTAVVVSVLGNDTDVEGDALTIVTVGTASNGTVTHDGTNVTYTPDPSFNGSDSFTYTVDDGNGGMDTATVNVTVNPVNDAPDAMDDAAGTQEDNAVVSNVLANDTDVDGDTLTITAVTNGANGTVTHDGTSTTYTPNLNFNGTDSYTYTISDGNGGTDTATVNVTVVSVNDFPLSVGDAVSTDEDTLVVVDVLANDSDADGDPLSITSVGAATNGTVTHDGAFVTYTPNANFNGADSFTYTISDGNGGFDTATVDVVVNAVNDDPDAVADSVTTDEDTAVVVDVRANDTDLDGDILTITSVGVAANGTVTHDGVNVTYTPNANFNGSDSFTYTISDGNGGVDTATVNVTVNAVNDNPVAVDDSATTDEDVAAVIDVLANDSDVDGDTLSISAVTNGTNGTVTHDGTNVTYTPNAGFFGTDSFSYTVSDGNGGTESATVNVTVNEVGGNVNPVAIDDNVSVNEDEVLNGNVLTNDTDADGDTLSATPANITTAGGGSVVLNSDGSFTYTPVAGFNGPDTFDYTVTDGNGGSDIGTVNITVNAVNDLPAPQDDEFEMDYGSLLVGNVLDDNGFGADSDPDGDALTIASMTVVTQQGVTVNITSDGHFTYVAPPNFFGFDSFTYTVDDGNGGQETAVATIQVKLPAGATSGSGIDDTIIGTGAAEVFFGFEGSDFIDGKGGNDVIYGGSLNGTDTVFGGAGNDVILGEGEGDNLSGEGGNDTIYGDGFGYETFVNGDDSIYGGGGDDTIYGGGGNDYIGGNGGADTLHGQDGDDLIQAGAGADTVYGGAGLDDLQGGGDNDIIYGDAGDDTLSGQGGDDTLYGGAGNDTMSGGAGADMLFGEAGDDIIDGNGGNDTIDAGEGNNTVSGGADDDTITAGSGNDYIEGNGGQDTINAGDGNNTVHGGAGFDNITSGSGDDIINGNGGADIVNAGDGNNTVTGGGDNDTITTGSGNDTILGNGGNDIINAGDGINTVTGGSGIDTITTGSGADTIEAKGGDDIIYAGAGDDNIQGNAGSDFLDGGLGADTLFGGADADIFDFNHTDAVDTVTDFNLNHGPLNEGDVLDISDLLTGFDPLSDTLSDWAEITDNGTDSFLSVDQDGAGTAFAMTQIAVLEGVTGLTDEDALVTSGNLIV